MMAAWVWQGCHTLLWFMKKETMACGHSLLYVFKVRGCINRAGWLRRYGRDAIPSYKSILFTRFSWRPPSNGVLKNSSIIFSAVLLSMKRPGITRMFASLCWRVS